MSNEFKRGDGHGANCQAKLPHGNGNFSTQEYSTTFPNTKVVSAVGVTGFIPGEPPIKVEGFEEGYKATSGSSAAAVSVPSAT
jgi:hypothetical protein